MIGRWVTAWCRDMLRDWDRFWFAPQAPHTLGMIRLLAGGMLFYTHCVWALNSAAFFGSNSWLPAESSRQWAGSFWTPLWSLQSPWGLGVFHLVALTIIAMATVGWKTRITTKLSWLVALAYVHRLHGALFGLDQVNVMLAMYLAVGPSGDAYSVDQWLRRRRGAGEAAPTWGANFAIRLMQVHLCVIYLFGGIGKMQGGSWWDGVAVWYAAASFEYQSMDMTWLVRHPVLVSALSHITTFWETFYCATVWPRATRWLTLGLAFAVHGGIALSLGMITFGLAMIFANMAFIPPDLIRSLTDRVALWFGAPSREAHAQA